MTRPWHVHKHSSECTSPMTTHNDQTTYQTIHIECNNSITWVKQSHHGPGKIQMMLPRLQAGLTHVGLLSQFLHWWYTSLQSYIPKIKE